MGHKRQDSETIVFGVNEEKARGKLSIKYNEKGKCKAIKSKKINDGNWHHIVWKQDGAYKGLYYGLYVDGIPMDDCLVPKNKRRAVAFEVTDKLQDKVKGIRVFDYVLSKEETKSIYDEELRKLKMLRPITDDIFIETEAKKSEFAN